MALTTAERKLIDDVRARPRIEVTSEPRTYHAHGEHSFFKDAWKVRLGDDRARERLARHEREVEVERRSRRGSQERRASGATLGRSGGWETRTPAASYSATPPLWLTSLEPPAVRPDDGVLAALTGSFPLPPGVATINLPAIVAGTAMGVTVPNEPVSQDGWTDTAYSSAVVNIADHSHDFTIAFSLP